MLDTRQCLVLNADYRPLTVWPLSLEPVRDSMVTLYKKKAVIVEDWGDVYRTSRASYPVPKVIALTEYVNVHATPKFCRRSVYLRDRYCCQYCGDKFDTRDLTFDHVQPRSRGGQTTWENVLTCCIPCNVRKRDRLVDHGARRGSLTSLRPLKLPRQPTSYELLKAGIELLDDTVKEDFASYLYWNAELKA